MASSVARRRPSAPIMAMYIQLMVRMLELPYGAALTGPMACLPAESGRMTG